MKNFFHTVAIMAAASFVRSDDCQLMRDTQERAREEIIAHGHALRLEIVRQQGGSESVNSTLLGDLFYNTYTFTANHTWEIFDEDCTTFVTTGDIAQMWLRDSSVQMSTYVHHAHLLPNVRSVLESIILRQLRFFLGDPYGSAFFRSTGPNDGPNRNECPPTESCPDCICAQCAPACSNYTYQHDFELDSPLFMFLLQYKYWQHAPLTAPAFLKENVEVTDALRPLIQLMTTEQNHFRDSDYFYKDLPRAFADGTGMVWSFARPSDDQVVFGYNIPQNIMAVSVLGKLQEMNDALWQDDDIATSLVTLKTSIEEGVERHGILSTFDPSGNDVFAFEVDGWGNWSTDVLDDANMPNLVWLPYLFGSTKNTTNVGSSSGIDSMEVVYQDTRSMILNAANENWFDGAPTSPGNYGLGSQHISGGLRPVWPGPGCSQQCIWHLGLIMQAMTSSSNTEKEACLQQVAATAWHGLMHEGFNDLDNQEYNRDYFGWANALFAEWVLEDFLSR